MKQKTVDINIANLRRISYVENTPKNHIRVQAGYKWLNQHGPKFFVYPWRLAGDHLTPFNDYSSIVFKGEPKSIKDFLRSNYIAIPMTNNKITSELYTHYYLEETPASQTPKSLSNASPLFTRLKKDYPLGASSPMLIGFVEAYLNTSKAGVTDLEPYSYLLLYNYIEHITLFDQYMTYEQKGMEIVRNDLAFNHLASSIMEVSLQLIDDISLLLLTEYPKMTKDFSIRTQTEVCLLDEAILIESLKFLQANRDPIEEKIKSVAYLHEYNPRTPGVVDSMLRCKQSLLDLKEILLRRDG